MVAYAVGSGSELFEDMLVLKVEVSMGDTVLRVLVDGYESDTVVRPTAVSEDAVDPFSMLKFTVADDVTSAYVELDTDVAAAGVNVSVFDASRVNSSAGGEEVELANG